MPKYPDRIVTTAGTVYIVEGHRLNAETHRGPIYCTKGDETDLRRPPPGARMFRWTWDTKRRRR